MAWPMLTGLQWRTEAVGTVLGLVGIAAPSVDRLLKSQLPGRGRAKSAALEATASVLAFSSALPQDIKQVLKHLPPHTWHAVL